MPGLFDDFNPDSPFTPALLEQTDEGRRALFGALRPDFLRTGSQKERFRNRFGTTFDDFNTQGAADVLGGRTPSTFVDFLKSRDFGRQVRREGVGRQQSPLVSAANFLFDR